MALEKLAGEAKQIIDRIAAAPRGAGGQGEARAREYCADSLARAGFAVAEEAFVFSSLPGKWAVPLFGLLSLTWFAVLAAALDRTVPEQTVREAMTFLPLLPVLYLGFRSQMRRPRFMKTSGVNLVAVRGGPPRMWLMAHLDTKSQPVPMLVRMAGIITATIALLLTIVASFIPAVYEVGNVFWAPVTFAGLAGSLAVSLSTVGDRSPGALDNASGVAATLLTAARAPVDVPIGVLITSGEELGLAGAWAWIREQADSHAAGPVRQAVNFDSLDDVGELICMSDRGNALAKSLRRRTRGARLRFMRVLPGLMVDSMPLNKSGWDAVTISKGNFSTLARIHTAGDSRGRLSGTGVAEAVELVTTFLKREN